MFSLKFSTESLYILPISQYNLQYNFALKLMFLSKFSPKFGWQKISTAGGVPGKSYGFFCKIFTDAPPLLWDTRSLKIGPYQPILYQFQ